MSTFLNTSSVVAWLGSLENWEAGLVTLGSIAATVIGTVWPAVRAFRKQREAALLAADKPVAPSVKPLPPLDPRFDALARQVSAVTEWSLEDARSEVRRLQKESALLRWQLDDAHTAVRDLERAVASADHRAQMAISELRENKKAMTSGVLTRASASNITPLRPPAKREG